MRRALRWIVIVAIGLVSGLLAAFGPQVYRLSNIGAGYIAKQMCSCIFVGERDFDSCRKDMPPDMFRVHAEVLGDHSGVRAWVTGIAERTARYTPDTGCTLY
jgi:hypothetical protein